MYFRFIVGLCFFSLFSASQPCWSKMMDLNVEFKPNPQSQEFKNFDKLIEEMRLFQEARKKKEGLRCFRLFDRIKSYLMSRKNKILSKHYWFFIKPWLLKGALKCLRSSDKRNISHLSFLLDQAQVLLQEAWPQETWFFDLKKEFILGRLIEVELIKDRQIKKAESLLNHLIKEKMWLNRSQEAQVYALSFDVALAQGQWLKAYEHIQKALEANNTKLFRAKNKAFQEEHPHLVALKKEEKKEKPEESEQVLKEKEFDKLYSSAERLRKSQKWILSVKAFLKVAQKFPEEKYKKRVLQVVNRILLNLSYKIRNIENNKNQDKKVQKQKKFQKGLFSLIAKSDEDIIFSASRRLYIKGFYKDVILLLEKSLKASVFPKKKQDIFVLLGKSYLFVGNYEKARIFFKLGSKKTKQNLLAQEAHFRLGLLEYRVKNYPKSEQILNSYVEKFPEGFYKMHSLYWLWRVQEKTNVMLAQQTKQQLILEYPLTYYGLRARLEGFEETKNITENTNKQQDKLQVKTTNLKEDKEIIDTKRDILQVKLKNLKEDKDELQIKSENLKEQRAFIKTSIAENLLFPKTFVAPIKVSVFFNEDQQVSWQLFSFFLISGWLEEAQKVIKQLPSPSSAEEKLVWARFYVLMEDYIKAMKLVKQAFDLNPDLICAQSLNLSYPFLYEDILQKEAQKNGLNELLLLSLIRQESAFNPKAVSWAGALGLMQLIPSTARDVRGFLKAKKLNLPEDMFHPERNIVFGTHYLKRLMRVFDKHIPLSLAAFNVGPGNMRNWLGSRKELENRQKDPMLEPEKEIWIDELPWAETSFYVKAILRNLFLYRFLKESQNNKS